MMLDAQEAVEAERSNLPPETEAPKVTAAKKPARRKAKPALKSKKSVKTAKRAKAEVKLRPDGLRVGSAGGLLVDTVCRKQGATHAELCEIVGWKQCLPFVIKSCKQAGVKLRKERKPGEAMRYFGIRKSR